MQLRCDAGDGRFVIGTRGGELHLYPAEPLRQWTIATTEFQTWALLWRLLCTRLLAGWEAPLQLPAALTVAATGSTTCSVLVLACKVQA